MKRYTVYIIYGPRYGRNEFVLHDVTPWQLRKIKRMFVNRAGRNFIFDDKRGHVMSIEGRLWDRYRYKEETE